VTWSTRSHATALPLGWRNLCRRNNADACIRFSLLQMAWPIAKRTIKGWGAIGLQFKANAFCDYGLFRWLECGARICCLSISPGE
jgi:uncharacterized protein YbdZ (MbtH family)